MMIMARAAAVLGVAFGAGGLAYVGMLVVERLTSRRDGDATAVEPKEREDGDLWLVK